MTSLGTLFTVSAPSGAGKTSLVNALADSSPETVVSVSHTTRPIRPGETDGINYHFVTHEQFESMVEQKAFLEHAKVFTNHYGTSKVWVEEQLQQGKNVILEIDWQGAQQVRLDMPQTVGVFILPPSLDTLRQRLTGRGQDDVSVIEARMAEAHSEISHFGDADYIIVNDQFDEALAQFRGLVSAEQLRRDKQGLRYSELISSLLPPLGGDQ